MVRNKSRFCKVLGRGTTNIDIGDKGRRLSEVAKTVAATFISHSPESDIDGPPIKAVTKSVCSKTPFFRPHVARVRPVLVPSASVKSF